jgi:hypothetical protein
MSSTPPTSPPAPFTPLLCVVDFHHARGPEIEHWIGAPPNTDPAEANDWSLIPYMALPDGAHSLTEEFSYFTLVTGTEEESSVFGISCTQQLDASKLLFKSEEVTRSAVQKAVVALTDRPGEFGRLREKLSVVTRAWFAQRDFRDVEILEVGLWGLGVGRMFGEILRGYWGVDCYADSIYFWCSDSRRTWCTKRSRPMMREISTLGCL